MLGGSGFFTHKKSSAKCTGLLLSIQVEYWVKLLKPVRVYVFVEMLQSLEALLYPRLSLPA